MHMKSCVRHNLLASTWINIVQTLNSNRNTQLNECVAHTMRYIKYTDNLIIVSAFVYFSPSINWPTCNLLLKLIFQSAKHEIRCKIRTFGSFFSLSLSCSSNLHCKGSESLLDGLPFLLPVIWLAFSLLARVKIYWAARVYNVKMVRIR